MSGILNQTGAVSGILGTTVGTPAAGGGVVAKISTAANYGVTISASNTTAVESDANDITVSCTIGNKLHIWITGGLFYPAHFGSGTGGIMSAGMRIEESGESDVDVAGSYIFSHPFTSGNRYHNDSFATVMYTHTAITASVTIKRLVTSAITEIAYWQQSLSSPHGIHYKVIEESV